MLVAAQNTEETSQESIRWDKMDKKAVATDTAHRDDVQEQDGIRCYKRCVEFTAAAVDRFL